jgi:hypothetical protein
MPQRTDSVHSKCRIVLIIFQTMWKIVGPVEVHSKPGYSDCVHILRLRVKAWRIFIGGKFTAGAKMQSIPRCWYFIDICRNSRLSSFGNSTRRSRQDGPSALQIRANQHGGVTQNLRGSHIISEPSGHLPLAGRHCTPNPNQPVFGTSKGLKKTRYIFFLDWSNFILRNRSSELHVVLWFTKIQDSLRRGDRGGFIFFRLVLEASFITFYSPFEGL